MAKTFAIPASPAVNTYKIEHFLGADFTTDDGQISENKSPNTVNMVRSTPGKIRKRMGFHPVSVISDSISGKINGIYHYDFADMWFIHIGTKLYRFYGDLPTRIVSQKDEHVQTENDLYLTASINDIETIEPSAVIMSGLANHKSRAYELKQKLIILDGTKARLVAWDADAKELLTGNLEDYAKIPTIRIAEEPEGGGSDYEAFNLLTKWFKEQFTVTQEKASTTQFHLWTKKIASDPVTAWVMNSEGAWEKKKEGEHFIVNRKEGIVDFKYKSSDPISSFSVNEDENLGSKRHDDYSVTLKLKRSAIGKTYTATITCKSGAKYSQSHNVTEDDLPDAWIGFYPITVTFDFKSSLCSPGMGAPGKSPVAGEDSVRIQAAYITEGNGADQINHCTFGTLYGVNGACDRLFISGNADLGSEDGASFSFQNRDWYSGRLDPTYFPDTGYSEIGSGSSAIVGYGKLGNYLMTYKDGIGDEQSAYLRSGKVNDEGDAQFAIVNALQGAGAVSNDAFGQIGNEPCFLSKKGIYATTMADVTGEKYIQGRSYFLDGKMLNEQNLSKAIGIEHDYYWIVILNNHFYMLDGLQPLPTSDNEPYSTRQYAGFYCELSLPAGFKITEAWEMDGGLYFAGTGKKIYRFYSDPDDCNSYNDDGNTIRATWETSDIAGTKFWKNKTFRYLAMKVNPALRSSVKMWAQKSGLWEMIKEETQKTRYFTFNDVSFNKLAFSTDKTQKLLSTKTRIKKVDKVRLRIENTELNEPLGVTQLALEYTSGGNIK